VPSYSFRAPNGQVFKVDTPAGINESQARAIFEQQFKTGSLTGLTPGQVLNAAQQASNGLTSALSQIRPTESKPLDQALNRLSSIPVSNPLNTAAFLKTPIDTGSIGNLNAESVKGLLAQTQSSVGQAFTAVTPKGVGGYAIPPQQLEQAGYLKPGTVDRFLKSGGDVSQVLGSPAVWTGKNGISNLGSLLEQPAQQARIVENTLNSHYETMTKTGVITAQQSPQAVAALLGSAAQVGVKSVTQWAKGAAPADLVNQINSLARASEFAVNFVGDKLPGVLGKGGGTSAARGFSGTVNRAGLDQAVTSILGSSKIPAPNYQAVTAPRATAPDLTLANQFSDAVREANQLRKTYQEVLRANNGDRLNADVVRAFDEFKEAQRRAEEIGKQIGV
jgi:hypothetical protein